MSPVADTVGSTPRSGSARGKPVQRQARLGAPWLARVSTAAAAATFSLHTARQAIYLSPGHGLRDRPPPPG
jgi:hypothetical protein